MQELILKSDGLDVYNPFRAQLKKLKDGNEKAVFDYTDPKGEKEDL